MKTLFVTWQDKESRKWFPVGKLVQGSDRFSFQYLRGALEAQSESGFSPLVSFPNFFEVYESYNLFPVFANRVVPSSRPRFREIIDYLDLQENEKDPMAFLARTGGAKVTDTFEMFPFPALERGWYTLSFFVHGLRYLDGSSIERIEKLIPNEKLFLMHDLQNPADKEAMALRTEDNLLVGYCPSYLLDDMVELKDCEPEIEICVERINNGSAPLQFKFLCRLKFRDTAFPAPFSSSRYRTIESLTPVEDGSDRALSPKRDNQHSLSL